MLWKMGSRSVILCAVLLVCMTGCTQLQLPQANRTVLVYMVADNNLNSYAWDDINDMEAGLSAAHSNNLLVYIDGADQAVPSHPILMEIEPDQSDSIVSSVVYSWSERNSANADAMKEVIEYTTKHYPANSYGLVLWSHGTAWLPSNFISELFGKPSVDDGQGNKNVSVKSFGQDTTEEMAIVDLSAALPVHFEFIAFDACYMGSVEVAYQLRNATDYLIASPSEILSDGFPYHSMVPQLFGNTNALIQAARQYFEYYDNKLGALRSASISVIETAKLEALARDMQGLLAHAGTLPSSAMDGIQQYDRGASAYLYDLYDTSRIAPGLSSEALRNTLNQVVLYSEHTNSFLQQLDFENVSGLSMYIPRDDADEELLRQYQQLDWYKDTRPRAGLGSSP